MTAKSRKEFFEQLGYELERLGMFLSDDIRADFEEHFDTCAADGISEESAAERLGDTAEIARSYLNIDSTRINSIVARDVERKRVSLTKPGRSAPADLSVAKSDPAAEGTSDMTESAVKAASDAVREYSPEHISGEIFPQANNVNIQKPSENIENLAKNIKNPKNPAQEENSAERDVNSQNVQNSRKEAENASSENKEGRFSAAGKAVSEAFSTAGKAASEAFATAGKALSDAFSESGKDVRQAFKNAGNEAVKGVQNGINNVKNRTNSAKERRQERAKKSHDPYKKSERGKISFEEFKGLKADPNKKKFRKAVAFDVLAVIAVGLLVSAGIGFFMFGVDFIIDHGIGCWSCIATKYERLHPLTRGLLGAANGVFGVTACAVGMLMFSAAAYVIRRAVLLHLKAHYNK